MKQKHSESHRFVSTCGKQGLKTAIGILTSLFEFRYMNRGRSFRMLREHGLDNEKIGGVLVVVRGGESPSHGKGEQPGRLSLYINRPNEVKTFDNR